MNQPLDALLQLHERAVVSHRQNAAVHLGAYRVTLRGIEPRVGRQLLEAQRNPLLFLVELEHLDLDFVGHVDQVAGMREPAPAHIGDMQQAVNAAQVNKRAVVGQVLHSAGEHGAFGEVLHDGRALGVLLFLEELLAADHHVTALLVELDDADFDLLAEIRVQVAHRADLQLRAGQKCLHPDVDGEAALDAADHDALDGRLVVGGLLNAVPCAQALGPLVVDQVAAFGLLALDHHFDVVAGLELHLAGVVGHLLQGQKPLGLEADIDHQKLFSLFHHLAGDNLVAVGLDGGRFGGLFALKGGQGGGEIVARLGRRRSRMGGGGNFGCFSRRRRGSCFELRFHGGLG